uniref:Uncharacterized protein n=1 Tax=Vitis vinifera TaxID=29760 RepID=A5BGX8_VITVI|nr:hypothetical protein VITISV_038475 [Vitis vinifera]
MPSLNSLQKAVVSDCSNLEKSGQEETVEDRPQIDFIYERMNEIGFHVSRPSEDGTIPLNIIAEGAKLSVEDVEYLFMKSLSVYMDLTLLALDMDHNKAALRPHGVVLRPHDVTKDNKKVAQGLNVLCKEMTW